MIYFTSDQHFGHDAVIKYCKRPYRDHNEMDADPIKKWNERVNAYDTIYILGDMFMGKFAHAQNICSQLKGRRVLIRGNHDKFSATQYRNLGFYSVWEECVVMLSGFRVRMSHFPYRPTLWGRIRRGEDKRFLHKRPSKKNNEFLLCGHIHQHWKIYGKQINVGLDQRNLRITKSLE